MKKFDEQKVKIVAYYEDEGLSFKIEEKKFYTATKGNVVTYGASKPSQDSYTLLSGVDYELYCTLNKIKIVISPHQWEGTNWSPVRNDFRKKVRDVLRQACKEKKEASDTFIVPGWEEEDKTVCQILNEETN